MEQLDELILQHQSCCKRRCGTSYLLGATCLIGGAATRGDGGGASGVAAGGSGGGAAAPIGGASCLFGGVLLKGCIFGHDRCRGVEFNESVVDNSNNLLVIWRVTQYNAACNFIWYHDAGIAFWSFSSSGIMADKMGKSLRSRVRAEFSSLSLVLWPIRVARKVQKCELFGHQRKGQKLCF